MGRYLITSISLLMYYKKKEAESCFKSVEKADEYLLNKYISAEIYNRGEDDKNVYYLLKEDIFMREIHDFAEAFFKLREDNYEDEVEEILSFLKKAKNMNEILEVSKDRMYSQFQNTVYTDPYWVSHDGFHDMELYTSGIMLTSDGKIEMECYGKLFIMFENLLREKLQSFKLSQSLRVAIDG